MKTKLLTISALTLLCANIAYADSLPPKPEVCPSPATVKALGLNVPHQDPDGTWVVVRLNDTFGNKEDWTFMIAGITATDANDALEKANKSLAGLKLTEGPSPFWDIAWICHYSTDEGYYGWAATPSDDNIIRARS